MPNRPEDLIAVCPYYEAASRMSITCEGAIKGTLVLTRFTHAEARDEHLLNYCAAAWKKCPHARNLNRLYEEER